VRKFALVLAAGALAALSLAAFSLASSKSTVWTASLTAAQEVPKQVVKNTAAHGQFKGTLTGSKLKWTLTFVKLTGPATAAHIHLGAMGKEGNVVVVLCASTCKSGKTGTATISATLQTAFKKHLLYVNVHTAKNPNGEIRGQLAAG
jgi:CHRD domain